MAISKARRNFRRVLYFCLGLSIIFICVMGYYYGSYKRTANIAPTIMRFDASQKHARVYFSSNKKKYETATELINDGFFSVHYHNAGVKIMDDLINDSYQPAVAFKKQYLHNNTNN